MFKNKYFNSFHFILFISLLFSISLIAFRVMTTHKLRYIFLVWNLFLAVIPFCIAFFVFHFRAKLPTIVLMPLLFMWLLFLPNAPYILTDLVHLRPNNSFIFWYDLLLLLSCGWNGLVLGLISIAYIQEVISKRWNVFIAWAVSFSCIFLCSFGIYLGRILRWNSWDAFTNTQNLFLDISERITNPLSHGRTLGVTLFYGIFLFILYLFIRLFFSSEIENYNRNQVTING